MELTHRLRKFIASTHRLPAGLEGTLPYKETELGVYDALNDLYWTGEGGNKRIANNNWDSAISDYQNINKQLEDTNNSIASKKFDTGQFITSLPSALGSAYNSFGYKSGNEMKAEALSGSGSVGGFGYETKTLNSKAIADERSSRNVSNVINTATSFAAAGSAAGPIGTAVGMGVGALVGGIGSIVGGNKEEQEQNLAQMSLNLENNAGRDFASTKSLRHQNAIKYGAKNGKIPGFVNGVASATGLVDEEATARVSNGEVIANKILGTMYRVPGIKNNKDGKLASLNNSDTVITNKYGLSDYAWRTGDIEGAEKMMMALTNPGYKCGKLPGHAEGWLGNAVPAVLGGIAGLGQVISAIGNEPYRPNTYSTNPYEGVGLNTLAGLRINPYPIMQLLRSAEARTNRAIDMAGGLSGGLRTAARLAALNATQNNISKVLSDIQQQNNAYRSSYAQAALNAGQQNRQARMSANQWDLDYYSKAHAARNRGMQTGIANMLAQIQQYQANEFKRRQFNETMALYRDDMDLRKKHMNWIQNHSGLNISQNVDSINNPRQYWNQLLPSEKWLSLYNRGIIG